MDKSEILAVILGGGIGSRLYPLTRERAKPAVPLAGKYRLIDIPMSNCFHAGIEKIAILTQFNSASLHRHIYGTYTRDVFSRGWVQILAAEQTPRSKDWYQGTADAVRKQLVEIREAGARYTVVLAGDHLYRMDYRKFVQYHIKSKADVTVAVLPVGEEEVSGFGILKLNQAGEIIRFTEKPKTTAALADLKSTDDPAKPYMASMGIYVFETHVLFDLLATSGDDFGGDIIPAAIGKQRVMGYVFDGYWEDIGTIKRFYQVNLEMALPDAPFDFYSPDRPIYTHARFLPASEVHGSELHHVLLTDGCRLYQTKATNCVIGLRTIISDDVELKASIAMGADFYETEADKAENRRLGRPDIGIGAGSRIEGAIIDKNARIGRNVLIRALPDREDVSGESWVSREGIIIVPKNAIVPDGTVI